MEPLSLTDLLREQTRVLHAKAEKSGIVADFLRGRAAVRSYALFLRQMAAAYQPLEAALERRRFTPGVDAFARHELYRSAALATDLTTLEGPHWRQAYPLLPAAERYARAIGEAANGTGASLIGHAYVRYLGDLSGGQILKRLLAKALGLGPQALSFYEFHDIDDVDGYKKSLRDDLNRAPLDSASRSLAIEAAVEAFAFNIEISEAVRGAVPNPV